MNEPLLNANELLHYKLWTALWKNERDLKTETVIFQAGQAVPLRQWDQVPATERLHAEIQPFFDHMTNFNYVRSVLNPMWTFPADPDDNTLCHLCVMNFQPDVLKNLLRCTSLNNVHYLSSKNRQGLSPMMLALKLMNFDALSVFMDDYLYRARLASGTTQWKFMGRAINIPNRNKSHPVEGIFNTLEKGPCGNHSNDLCGSFVVQYDQSDSALLELMMKFARGLGTVYERNQCKEETMRDFPETHLSPLFSEKEASYVLETLLDCFLQDRHRAFSHVTKLEGCAPLRTKSPDLFGQGDAFTDTDQNQNSEPGFCKIFVRLKEDAADPNKVTGMIINRINGENLSPDQTASNAKYIAKKTETWCALENDFHVCGAVYEKGATLPGERDILGHEELMDTIFLAAACRNWHYAIDRMKIMLRKINRVGNDAVLQTNEPAVNKFLVSLFSHKLSTAREWGTFSDLLERRKGEFVPSILRGILKWGVITEDPDFSFTMLHTLFSLLLISRHTRTMLDNTGNSWEFPAFGLTTDNNSPAVKLADLGISADKEMFLFNLINTAWMLGDWEVIEWQRTLVHWLVVDDGNLSFRDGPLLSDYLALGSRHLRYSPLYGRPHVFETFTKARALIHLLLGANSGFTPKHFLENKGAENMLVRQVMRQRGLFSFEKLFPARSELNLSLSMSPEGITPVATIGMTLIQNTCDPSEFLYLFFQEVAPPAGSEDPRPVWSALGSTDDRRRLIYESFGQANRTVTTLNAAANEARPLFEDHAVNPATIDMAELLGGILGQQTNMDEFDIKMKKIHTNFEDANFLRGENFLGGDHFLFLDERLTYLAGRREDHKTILHLLAEFEGVLADNNKRMKTRITETNDKCDLGLCCKDASGNTFLHSLLEKTRVNPEHFGGRAQDILGHLIPLLQIGHKPSSRGAKTLMLSRNLSGKTAFDLILEMKNDTATKNSVLWEIIKDSVKYSPEVFIYNSKTYRHETKSGLIRDAAIGAGNATKKIATSVAGTSKGVFSSLKNMFGY